MLVVLLSTTLLMGLGAGLALLTTTEARITAHFGAGIEALYAAEAAIERVLPDLRATGEWDDVLAGRIRSTFVDGEPGMRILGDGTQLDLTAAANLDAAGPWRLYAHAPIGLLSPGRIRSGVYVVVWVADEAADPAADALVLHARAYGIHGARRSVEVVVARDEATLRVLSWRAP